MKKTLVATAASAVVALGLVAHIWCADRTYADVDSPLEASLAAGAAGIEIVPAAAVASSYDLSAHQTLSRVILLIRENYVDPERVKPYEMFLAALDYIQKAIPEVMIDDSAAPEQISVSVASNSQVFELGDLDQLWEVTMALRDIFRFLQGQIDDATQRRDIEYAAINGMLSTLDPHSVLLKPESFDEVKLSTKGEFGGLGIVISIRDGSLTIISPIAGTPASRAGLRAKDKIVKIGEESTVNMSLEEAVHRLRGKPQTKVAVWILRKNWTEARRYELTRAVIKIESVTSELLAGGVGYVRIKSFQNNTYDDLRTHLERLRRKNRKDLKGVVLDLRNNPGGLLDQAILVSDRFIDRGPLVITVGEGNRKREVKPAHFTGTETGYPIAVLVNGGSASASEIVSGALKNHDRAIVIGQQTFGKGSVQVLYDFKDKSALKLTIAQYLTPGDISIQSVGISPDVEIVPATVEKGNIHLFVNSDAPREKDLEMHLEQHRGNAPAQGGALVRMTHLLPVGDDDGDEPVDETLDEFQSDFEIELAQEVLSHARGLSRQDILKGAMKVFESRAAIQEQAVGERLDSFGVDWSKGPDAGAARVETSLRVVAQRDGAEAPPGDVRAGDALTLIGTVRNTGEVPLYRVYGTTRSDNPLLKNRELVFGKVDPGKSRTWSTQVKLPKELGARADRLTMELGDLHGATGKATAATLVRMGELPKPRFAYQYVIDDSDGGNGDGELQMGERVRMRVSVRNLGPGDAQDAMLTVKNLSGRAVFLDRGREKIGAIPAGERKVGTLRFSVKRKPQSGVDGDGHGASSDRISLRIGVWDNELGASLSEPVEIPLVAARPKARADRRSVKVGDAAVNVYAAAQKESRVLATVAPGTLLRGEAVLRAGKWRRVQVLPDLPGFVAADSVSLIRGRKVSRGGVTLAQEQAPPRIELELGPLFTSSDSLRLRGEVRDERALKDMFVFVNDKKVYYRSLEGLHPGPAAGLSASFDIRLPLSKGSNNVAVVVRETDDMVTRRVVGVYRDEPSALAELPTVSK